MIEPKYLPILEQTQGVNYLNEVLQPEILAVHKHYCKARLPYQPRLCNYLGIYHGGVIYGFGDALVGIACRTEGERAVTLSGEIHYIRNQSQGDIFAETVLVHHGKSTGVYRVVFRGADERILAEATYTMFFFSDGAKGETQPLES